MAAITVANVEWDIIAAVKTALANAAIDGSAVFAAVYVTPSEVEFRQAQMRDHPVAVVRYLTTEEDSGLDGERNLLLEAEIHIGTIVESDDELDDSDRVQEALRLMNAAKNAVESSLPADADAVGDDDFYVEQIAWGQPELDLTSNRPWARVILPVSFGFRLTSATAH